MAATQPRMPLTAFVEGIGLLGPGLPGWAQCSDKHGRRTVKFPIPSQIGD